MRRGLTEPRGALLLFALAAAAFGFLEWRSPWYFLADDNANQYLPYYCFNWRSVVERGAIPLINWHQYLGQTYLGQAQSGVFYFPVYLALAASKAFLGHPWAVIELLAIGHLLLAGEGMRTLLRARGISPMIALLGGLAWATLPFCVVAARSWIFVSYLAAFLPWNFWLLDRLLAKPTLRRGFLLGALKAVFFFQGYVQYVLLSCLFEALYLAATAPGRARGNRWPPRAWFLSVGWFLALAAPLLGSLWVVKGLSLERNAPMPLSVFMVNRMFLADFLRAQVFCFQPEIIFDAGNQIFHAGLIHVAAWIALGSRAVRARARAAGALPLLLLAALAFTLATSTGEILYHVPILNLFRWPFKSFAFFLFFTVIASAEIWDAVAPVGTRSPRIALALGYAISLALQLGIAASPGAAVTFGPGRFLPPPSGASRDLVRPDGRVFTYRSSNVDPARYSAFGMFDYATLHGWLHFGGYDALVSGLNSRLSLGLQHDNSYDKLLDAPTMEHLERWGVRYLLCGNRPTTRRILARFPQLRLLHEDAAMLISENPKAHALAHFTNAPQHPLPIAFGVNSLRVTLPTPERGDLRILVAPIPGFSCEVDGRPATADVTPYGFLIRLDTPAREIILRYSDRGERFGSAFGAGLGLLLLIHGALSRRRAIRESTATPRAP